MDALRRVAAAVMAHARENASDEDVDKDGDNSPARARGAMRVVMQAMEDRWGRRNGEWLNSYAALGKRLLQHQAQAELYVLRGSVPAAIEQLQLAQAAGDGDFYELSAVEARLKELRARYAQDMRDVKR